MRTFRSCGTAFRFSTASDIRIFQPWAIAAAMRLLEQILSALMDRQDRDAPEESFELVM